MGRIHKAAEVVFPEDAVRNEEAGIDEEAALDAAAIDEEAATDEDATDEDVSDEDATDEDSDFDHGPAGPNSLLRWCHWELPLIVQVVCCVLAIPALYYLIVRFGSKYDIENYTSTRIRAQSIRPIQYSLMYHLHMDDASPTFFFEARVAILVQSSSEESKFFINAPSSKDVKTTFIVEHDPHIGPSRRDVNIMWEEFPYVDKNGHVTSGHSSSAEFPSEHDERYEIPKFTRVGDNALEFELRKNFTKAHYKNLLFRFNGTMSSASSGIFLSEIPNSDDVWLAIQSQPKLARTLLPCFDEPALHALFKIDIAHPAKYIALSNTPVDARVPAFPGSYDMVNRYVWTRFKVSEYLAPHRFGFVVGPFEEVKNMELVKSVPAVKLYALPQGNIGERTKFAANVTMRALEFYKKYINVNIAAEELKMVIVPTKFPIDSVTSGLVLHREEAILLNTSTATVQSLEKAARTVIHYIIQHFVEEYTLISSWDDVRATKALISFMENECVQTIFPDWKVWETFDTVTIHETLKFHNWKRLPSAALPEEQYYPKIMFDSLTSQKGAAILRMFEMWPGRIRAIAKQYLQTKREPFGVDILARDLTFSMTNPPELDAGTIQSAVCKWISETSYPLLRFTLQTCKRDKHIKHPMVIFHAHDTVTDIIMSQERYSEPEMGPPPVNNVPRECTPASGKYQKSGKDPDFRIIPINLVLVNDSVAMHRNLFWQTSTFHRVCGGFGVTTEPIIVNYGQRGFFRVDYDENSWKLIAELMRLNPKMITPATRAMLIDDAMAMAKLGRISFKTALKMPFALLYHGIGEKFTPGDVGMFERGMRVIAEIHDSLYGSPIQYTMQRYMGYIINARWHAVNLPEQEELEKAFTGNLTDVLANRTSILMQQQAIFWACYVDKPQCLTWALGLIRGWERSRLAKKEAVFAEHFSNAYCIAVRNGPDNIFDFLWDRYLLGNLTESHKTEILWALLCTDKREKIAGLLGDVPGKKDLVNDTLDLWQNMRGLGISAWYAFKLGRTYWNNIPDKMFDKDLLSHIIVAVTSAASSAGLDKIQRYVMKHSQALQDFRVVITDNYLNIDRGLTFREKHEANLEEALKATIPDAWSLKVKPTTARPSLAPPDSGFEKGSRKAHSSEYWP